MPEHNSSSSSSSPKGPGSILKFATLPATLMLRYQLGHIYNIIEGDWQYKRPAHALFIIHIIVMQRPAPATGSAPAPAPSLGKPGAAALL